jgi:N-methylhydantoinase A
MAAKEKNAVPLDLAVPQAAAAIYDVVNAKMAGAIDVVFSKRGYDPRDFSLCAAGGPLPVYAARLVKELRIKDFVVPKVAPVFCAFGMLYADLRHNFTRPYQSDAGDTNLDEVNALFADMEEEAIDILRKEGIDKEDIAIERSMDIRYKGQRRELTAAVTPNGFVTVEALGRTLDRFHDRHSKIIGYSDPSFPVEIVRLHLAGIYRGFPPQPCEIAQGGHDVSDALKGIREGLF